MARWIDWLGLIVCLMVGLVFLLDYFTTPKKFGPNPQFSVRQRRQLKRMGLVPRAEKQAGD
eukprot:SAG31_NODE_11788_length_998_cov_1.570634_2_plen_61_part_00